MTIIDKTKKEIIMGGRGSWTTTGKSNLTRQYTYVAGLPLDGSEKSKGDAYLVVNLGIKGIQNEINVQKLAASPLIVDGVYGAKTAQGVREAQGNLGVGPSDGKAGSVTCKRLWRAPIAKAATLSSIDPKYLYAQMCHESGGDPSAQGYVNAPDSGLTQINIAAHPEVTLEQAYTPKFNLEWAAKRFKEAMDKYKAKPELQVQCAILQHNSPASSDTYFRTGVYPNTKSELYVEAVFGYIDEW